MIGLTADVDIDPLTDLLGKTVGDLQSGVIVDNYNKTISGTLAYVDDYTGFSGDPREQQGNYLAVHFATEADNATISIRLIGGLDRVVTLDPDGLLVTRVSNTNQKIQVTVTVDGADPQIETYTLRGLNLTPAS